MNRIREAAKSHHRIVMQDAKMRKDADRLYRMAVLHEGIYALVDLECPHCHKPLDLPSLEDIQEWLKEEK